MMLHIRMFFFLQQSSDSHQLQFHNNSMLKMFGDSVSFIQNCIFNSILEGAHAIITNNQFVRENLMTYIIDCQQITIDNLVRQSVFLPQNNHIQEDVEALPLEDDNLMHVNHLDVDLGIAKTNKSYGNNSKKCYVGRAKVPASAQKRQIITYKSITKGLNIRQSIDYVENHQQEVEYISRLREYKEIQLKQKVLQGLPEIRKPKFKYIKGQKIMFDYEGNIQKAKQLKNGQFQQEVLSTSIQKPAQKQERNEETARLKKNTTILHKLNERSIRNRTETKAPFQFLGESNRELIINTLKLSNAKTKMTFDGQNIAQTEQTQVKTTENSTKLRKKLSARQSTIKKIELNQEDRQRKKTQALQIEITLSLKGTDEKVSRRVVTELSEGRLRGQRINVENQALRKALLTEVEDAYFQLPKNRIKRAITNIDTVSSTNHLDLLKIRERLKIKTNQLPQILSCYSNLQRNLLRERRKHETTIIL